MGSMYDCVSPAFVAMKLPISEFVLKVLLMKNTQENLIINNRKKKKILFFLFGIE
jgi:hypothetical protein